MKALKARLLYWLFHVKSPSAYSAPTMREYYRDVNAAYEAGYRAGRMSGRILEAIKHIKQEGEHG